MHLKAVFLRHSYIGRFTGTRFLSCHAYMNYNRFCYEIKGKILSGCKHNTITANTLYSDG